jgi:hypothetical protein
MGYSVYAVIGCEKLARQLYKYLNSKLEHHELPCAYLASNFHQLSLTYADHGKDKCQIGFDYGAGCHEIEQAFIFDVVRWVAQKAGQSTYVYDGIEERQVGDKMCLDLFYEMSHVKNKALRAGLRLIKGMTKREVNLRKRRIQELDEGWKP